MTYTRGLVLALLTLSYAFGQATDGNITGTVLDPSGAAVSGATVTAQNTNTGARFLSTTDSNGTYRFDHLLVGSYTITTVASGFAISALAKVAIELNKTTTLN